MPVICAGKFKAKRATDTMFSERTTFIILETCMHLHESNISCRLGIPSGRSSHGP